MGKSKYRIVATPQYQTVSPSAKVTYACAQQWATIEAIDSPRDQFQWFCVNDFKTAKEKGEPYIVKGPAKWAWEEASWTFPGRHTLQCHVRFTEGDNHVYEHVQTVEPVDAILSREFGRLKKEKAESPDMVRSAMSRYVTLLKDIEKTFPIENHAKKEEHDKLVAAYESYVAKLDEVLEPTKGKVRRPIRAFHLEIETQKKTDLRVFVARVDESESSKPENWVLVDWTDPTDRARTGQYERSGKSSGEAIQALIAAWDSGFCGNRYPRGVMKWEVPGFIAGEFPTTGRSYLDIIRTGLEWVGMAAAGVAMVVALVAPVPGSRVLSAAIWVSVFSSTGAAVINIGQRHEEGFGSWKDDAFDTLTIAGNVFAGAGTWVRGATVMARGAGGTLIKGAIIGQITTSSVQGVILTTDYAAQYDAIMSDKALAPAERAEKLLQLFRAAAIAGAMTYVSVRGSARDLANLNAKPKYMKGEAAKTPAEKLEALKDPAQTVDLTAEPVVEGHTSQGKIKTTVQVEQARATTAAKPKSRFEDAIPNGEQWEERILRKDYIYFRHRETNSAGRHWEFEATNDNGTVSILVYVKERSAGKTLSKCPDATGPQFYELMFDHFEANGLQIKRWKGEFMWDNYKAAKAALAAGKTGEEVVESVVTYPFWKKYFLDKKGLKIKLAAPLKDNYFPDMPENSELEFVVDFVPVGSN